MGLKALNARHYDIIRRLIVGQTNQEISVELGISQSRISVLKDDPLFDAAYQDLADRVVDGFIETRATTMQILEEAAPDAALLVRDVVRGRTVDGETPSLPLRLKSAWDCLDRTGNRAAEKHLVGHVDLAELINKAYKEKYRGDGDNGNGEESESSKVPMTTALVPVEDANGRSS